MNKVLLMGRTTRDPEVRYSQGEKATAVARLNLAVDRRFKKDGEASADFIPCVAFGKTAEVIEKYVVKGTKLLIVGRIQTGSYTNKDGNKVHTTDIMIEDMEFAESKKTAEANGQSSSHPRSPAPGSDGFMNIPDGIDEELPFN